MSAVRRKAADSATEPPLRPRLALDHYSAALRNVTELREHLEGDRPCAPVMPGSCVRDLVTAVRIQQRRRLQLEEQLAAALKVPQTPQAQQKSPTKKEKKQMQEEVETGEPGGSRREVDAVCPRASFRQHRRAAEKEAMQELQRDLRNVAALHSTDRLAERQIARQSDRSPGGATDRLAEQVHDQPSAAPTTRSRRGRTRGRGYDVEEEKALLAALKAAARCTGGSPPD